MPPDPLLPFGGDDGAGVPPLPDEPPPDEPPSPGCCGAVEYGLVVVATPVTGGVLVRAVRAGGPADKAGIRPGDVILEVDGQPVPSSEDLSLLLAGHKPGDRIQLTIVRQNGQRATVTVTLGSEPGA